MKLRRKPFLVLAIVFGSLGALFALITFTSDPIPSELAVVTCIFLGLALLFLLLYLFVKKTNPHFARIIEEPGIIEHRQEE